MCLKVRRYLHAEIEYNYAPRMLNQLASILAINYQRFNTLSSSNHHNLVHNVTLVSQYSISKLIDPCFKLRM